jgi:hypothetical protein
MLKILGRKIRRRAEAARQLPEREREREIPARRVDDGSGTAGWRDCVRGCVKKMKVKL